MLEMIWFGLSVWKYYSVIGDLLERISNWQMHSCFVYMPEILGNICLSMQLFRKYAPPEMLFYKFTTYLQNTYFEEHSWLIASKIDVFCEYVFL